MHFSKLSENRLAVAVITGAVSVLVLYKIIRQNGKRRNAFSLSGKVVCLTGANGGLGKALAKSLASRGAKLILTGRRMERLENLRTELMLGQPENKVDGQQVKLLELDMEDISGIPEKAHRILSDFGTVDVLILNAGISSRGSVVDSSFDVVQRMMAVNFLGPIALTKELLPSLLEKDSCIVAVSSVQGRMAIPFRSSYAASKHALQAFFDSFRAERIDGNPNILVVSPSYIRTSLSVNALGPDGTPYGKMDDTTANGMDPAVVAEKIVRGIELRESELIISDLSPKIGILLRAIFPVLYMKIMRKRAQKYFSSSAY